MNIDETGCIPYVDTKSQMVVYDTNLKNSRLEIYVDRSIRRVTLLGGISADGGVIRSFVITSRKTLDREIYYTLDESHFYPIYQVNGFLTKDLLVIWLNVILANELKKKKCLERNL